MNIVSGIVLFIIIWWIVLFVTLPFKVQDNSQYIKGSEYQGAPKDAYIGYKILVTTVITAMLWAIVYYLLEVV